MKKGLLLSLLILLLTATLTKAENYAVNVTLKDTNVYKVDGKDLFIHTQLCLELALSEKSYLSMTGYQGDITFSRSGRKYTVEGVYGQSNQSAGDYRVRVSQEENDWYEISGTSMFIKTDGCMSMAMGREAIVTINSNGYGEMLIDGRKCRVEGIYGRMSL